MRIEFDKNNNEVFYFDENNGIESEANELFEYIKTIEYPNYDRNNYDIKKEMKRLIDFDEKTLIKNGNVLKKSNHMNGMLWMYFPHWIDIECNSSKSINELWHNEYAMYKLALKCVNYSLKHNVNHKMTLSRLRQNAKVYLCKQTVSNFHPAVAKYIYNTYGNKGTIYDMSSGFGGRLSGFLSSDCKEYIGCDPSTKTYKGLLNLASDYSYIENKRVEINCIGSEDYVPTPNSIDLAFTSPPYFNTEKYSNEDTQSYMKFSTIEDWKDGFLRKTIQNCKIGLKDSGYMIFNVANVKSYTTFEEDTVKIALEEGFILEDTLLMELSSISGNRSKYEKIFVFKVDIK